MDVKVGIYHISIPSQNIKKNKNKTKTHHISTDQLTTTIKY